MSQSAAAAVIDLDSYRRRKQPKLATPALASSATVPYVWVVWVPVWLWQ